MEAAAAAVSFVAFAFQSFEGCVRAFEFFSTAQNIGSDGDLLRVGLEFEKYRLLQWAERSGVDGAPRVTLNWPLARTLLEQLESFLTSADRLRDRYSLAVTEETIAAAAGDINEHEESKPGVSKLIARLKPNIHTRAGKVIQSSNSPIKRLRWATRDKDKLTRFLGEVTELVNKLEHLLERAEADADAAEYNKLLRDVLSLTSTAAEAGQIKEITGNSTGGPWDQMSISAAAHLKQVRLAIGADRRDDELKPTKASEQKGVQMPILEVLKRSLKPWNGQALTYLGAEFAVYRGKQVLLQWKVAEGIHWEKYRDQMKCLTVLLMSLRDPSFRSLQCPGYYPLEREGRHGIMYAMPDDDVQWDFQTMDNLITQMRLVPLHRRLDIAKALSETILQLHTAGWMHKNLRSHNVIFLAPKASTLDVFLQSEPILIGYDYARPDTAEAALALTQLPDTDLRADLYRHPQARGAGREIFQKRFDMYALGSVILESILWTRLEDLFVEYQSPNLPAQLEEAMNHNQAIDLPSISDLLENKPVLDLLAHQAGARAKDIIETCVAIEKKDEDQQWDLREQNYAVDQLTWYRI